MRMNRLILIIFLMICCACVGSGQQNYAQAIDSSKTLNDLVLEVRTSIKHEKSPVYLFLFPEWQASVISALSGEAPVAININDYLSEDNQKIILPLNAELLLYNGSLTFINLPLKFDLDLLWVQEIPRFLRYAL